MQPKYTSDVSTDSHDDYEQCMKYYASYIVYILFVCVYVYICIFVCVSVYVYVRVCVFSLSRFGEIK